MKPSIFLSLVSGLSILLFTGCAGYQLGEVKPGIYRDIKKIHVPPFKNLTLEPRLSSLVTNAVLAEMQADGTYEVASRANCDAVLVGQISHVDKYQLRSVRNDTLKSRELSLYLLADFHLEDPRTGARIEERAASGDIAVPTDDKMSAPEEIIGARQGRVIGDTIQFVDPSFQIGERNALAVVAEDLADKLVSQLANGW
ncbi:MAG: hypothetical protein GXX91_08085 [Verrucomicrobiaceae bacterium]|nr:hypothetical protein [Verrucomicrobiaceae bacterium]